MMFIQGIIQKYHILKLILDEMIKRDISIAEIIIGLKETGLYGKFVEDSS